MAARASCPSISRNPNPLQRPENKSFTSFKDRTVPNCENNTRTESSVLVGGKLPTNSFFNI
jgi:hypothetical protein